MMFIVRTVSPIADCSPAQLKLTRRTPAIVPNGAGKTDHFCVGDAEEIAALRERGLDIVELRDGYYHDDNGGGVAVWGQGRYWELREEPLSVKEAVGPGGQPAATGENNGEQVNVRRAIFGV